MRWIAAALILLCAHTSFAQESSAELLSWPPPINFNKTSHIYNFQEEKEFDNNWLNEVTWNSTPAPGTVRIKYYGWRGAAVNEIRRQLYKLWDESLELRYNSGVLDEQAYSRARLSFAQAKEDEDLLGRWWDRKFWECRENSRAIWIVGNTSDLINLGVVRITGDWRTDWRGAEGRNGRWVWKVKPEVSLGSTGLKSAGLRLGLAYKGRRAEWARAWVAAGWSMARGGEIGFGLEMSFCG